MGWIGGHRRGRMAGGLLAVALLVTGGWAAGVPGWFGSARPAAAPAPSAAPPACPAGRGTRMIDVGGEVGCIGYTDRPAAPLVTGNRDLDAAEARIFANNAKIDEAERRWHQVVYTVVYLGQLTGIPASNAFGYAADSEELNGLALAQNAQLDPSGPSRPPLMRVVIANAGFQMHDAERVAAMIVELAARDPSVLAVVGLVESREQTGKALALLQRHGLAAIAPTISADQLTDDVEHPSAFYLQIAGTNHAQSALITAYLRSEMARRRQEGRPPLTAVRLYYTTAGTPLDQDWYVNSLTGDLRTDLRGLPGGIFDGDVRPWATGTALACDGQTAVVFAGRWNDFGGFLEAAGPCASVVADDSVTRYMASADYRTRAAGVSLTYVAKGYLASCDALRADDHGTRGQFLNRLRMYLGLCRDQDDFMLGERMGLAYDAAMLLAGSVDRLLARMGDQPPHLAPITSMAVHTEILSQYGRGGSRYDGVTGQLTFDPRGAPVDRLLSLVQVADVNKPGRPREVFRCEGAACRSVPAG